MAMAVGGSKGGPRAEINVTPMIDVLLVLLIIFMVITPLTPYGLNALAPQPPEKNQPPPKEDTTIVIVVDKQGGIKINSEAVEKQSLGGRLTQIFSTRVDRTVFVKGDPDADFEMVADAIDIAKGAGMDKIGLMTPKVEAGQ